MCTRPLIIFVKCKKKNPLKTHAVEPRSGARHDDDSTDEFNEAKKTCSDLCDVRSTSYDDGVFWWTFFFFSIHLPSEKSKTDNPKHGVQNDKTRL